MADGFVAVRGAVPDVTARACADVVWSELAARGIDRADATTWTEPVARVGCPEGGPFVHAGTAARLREACDQLLGEGRWWRREGVGGSIPIRFPSAADPGDSGWHLDGGAPDADGRTQVTVRARGGGLLALFLFSDVDERSAPTRLRSGSHVDTARVLEGAGDDGMEWGEASRLAAAAAAHRPIALATGRAGDVYLCHQLLVHAASWPHTGQNPRIIAQPTIMLLGEYRLPGTPAAAPTPAERAIMRGLGT